MPLDPIGAVRRELLVRHLEAWLPYALHRSRRATFVLACPGTDAGTAEAALRVLVEFADLLRGRRLAVLVLTEEVDALAVRLRAVQSELPAGVTVHPVPGGIDRLPVALRAASAAGAPVLAYLVAGHGPAPTSDALAALTSARPAEVMLALGARARAERGSRARAERDGRPGPDGSPWRAMAEELGLSLVTEVELVAAGPAGGPGDPETAELVVFATSAGRRLDAFKDAMWAVDEYAGVRYRDPGDPRGHLLDISSDPHPGPLRRGLLARLARVGPATVTELRQFTATRTVYRAADTNRALTALLTVGQVSRDPAHGRLAGDVLVTLVDAGGGCR